MSAAAAAAGGLCYAETTYPYFFKDADGDKKPQCAAAEATTAGRFSAWTAPLVKAAHNYQLVHKDPGSWAPQLRLCRPAALRQRAGSRRRRGAAQAPLRDRRPRLMTGNAQSLRPRSPGNAGYARRGTRNPDSRASHPAWTLKEPRVLGGGIKMSERGSPLLFPATVRRNVLEQHTALRELLQRALEESTRGLRREGSGLSDLCAAARELHGRFHAHLAFEERALAPLLGIMDLWGPERVATLLAEHDRQRAEMNTILEGIEAGWDAERIALTLRSLATDLLVDMEEEERGCLDAELLRQDAIEAQPRTWP